ncbi:MAG: acyl--CoA ligase [Streptosporangiales bacterium]|nr:acyl--CoA ligase [Streptosporangiales bacterium]
MDDTTTDVTRTDIGGLPPVIPALLRARAAEFGGKKLLVCDDAVLTYAEAERRSAVLARCLLGLGAGKGSHVGILYPNGPEFAVATFAAARIGAVSVPLSTMSTAPELRTMLRGADVRVLLSARGYRSRDFTETVRDAVPGAGDRPAVVSSAVPALRHVFFDDEKPAGEPGREPVPESVLAAAEAAVTPADRLVIVHTSGSTSEPKAVIHTHGGLIRHMRSLDEIRRYDSAEILFSNSPFFWIGGYASNLVATLEAGATLICSNTRDAGETLDLLERERPTLVNGYAQSVAPLAAHPSFAGRDLSSIRRGNLYPIMPAAVRPADPKLRHDMLGMTEAGSMCLLSGDESDQPESRRGSFGTPHPGLEARIMDPDTGRERGPGEDGELHFRGPFMMDGYYGRERRDVFDADGWYATGDIVARDADGFFYFKGRRSAMIKTSGANVSPREVEAAIADLTGLTAHVTGVEDATRGQIVAAAIVTDDPVTLDTDGLRRRLARRLSSYKIPRRIRAVPAAEVPLMTSGKIDPNGLRDLLQ